MTRLDAWHDSFASVGVLTSFGPHYLDKTKIAAEEGIADFDVRKGVRWCKAEVFLLIR